MMSNTAAEWRGTPQSTLEKVTNETVIHPVMTMGGRIQDCVTYYPDPQCFCGYYRIEWWISQNHLIA